MSRLWLYMLVLTQLSLITTPSIAMNTQEIIEKIENNLNGDTAIMDFSMIVTTKRNERTMRMTSYSVGNTKSFIKITYPGKDKGITFLKIDNTMWQYVPRIEKIIKIPASMMLQSWMGSDFTNDDLVKESSLSKDYQTRLTEEKEESFILQLIPNENAPVVWGKIIMEVSRKYYLPTVVHYYDEDDELIRILEYSRIKKLDDRYYPTLWLMTPQSEQKKGHMTRIEIGPTQFNTEIDSSYFTKRALKRYSK